MGRLEDTRQARKFHWPTAALWLAVLWAIAATSSPAAAAPAPDFTLPNIDGKEVTLSKLLADGPVIIDFWATWCKPCLKGFPGLQAMYEKYRGRGLRVVTISVDSPRSRAGVAPLIKSKKYTFEVLLDTQGRVAKKYNAVALPRTVLLSPDGEIVFATVGYRPSNDEKLEEALVPILQAKAVGDGEAAE
jgi:cytochrome c biogenesis protein CcmG/thiol:disulfide interchange protein DsbE